MALNFLVGGRTGLVENAVQVQRLVVQVHVAAAALDFAQAEVGFNLGGVALLVDELGHELVAVRRAGRPERGFGGQIHHHPLLTLPGREAQREVGLAHRPGASLVLLEHLQAHGIEAGVLDAGGQVEAHEPVFNHRFDAHARAQAVALHHFQPHRAYGAGVRLVPDAAALVDVRLLLAAGRFGVHGVGNAHGEAVDGPQVLGAQLKRERSVLAVVHGLALDGAQRKAVEPDPRLVAAGAEGELKQRVRIVFGAGGQVEVALVPGHHAVLPGGGLRLLPGRSQVIFY